MPWKSSAGEAQNRLAYSFSTINELLIISKCIAIIECNSVTLL